MKRNFLAIFALCAVFSASLAAQTLSIVATSIDGTAYNSNNRTEVWIDGKVRVTRSSTTPNPLNFTVDLAPNADQVNNTYPRNANWIFYTINGQSYPIYLDSSEIFTGSTHYAYGTNVWKLWSAAGIGDAGVAANNVWSGSFTGSTTALEYPFAAVFWENGLLDNGFYELPITFRVRKETFSATAAPQTDPVASSTVMLRFIVGEYATIFFKNQVGGTEILDLVFDDVTTGVQKSFAVAVQSNFKYHLSVKSTNGLKLRHERYGAATSPVNEQISYFFAYEGSNKTLGAGVVVRLASNQKANVSGTTYGTVTRDKTINLTLGTISDFTAGKYSDTLSFIITSAK